MTKEYEISNHPMMASAMFDFANDTPDLVQDMDNFLDKFKFKETFTKDKLSMRHSFLQEELDELKQAIQEDNKVEIIDALVDIVYIALGTSNLMGFDFYKHWEAVHTANMSKERGIKPGREFTGGYDVIKPSGWVGPDEKHQEILKTTKLNVD